MKANLDKALQGLKKEPVHRTIVRLPKRQWEALLKLKEKHGSNCTTIISVAIDHLLKEIA